jgi:hypothetical protein
MKFKNDEHNLFFNHYDDLTCRFASLVLPHPENDSADWKADAG